MKIKLTITASDCIRDTFRCGGAGGQNVNKRETGVRFTHPPSGAVGKSCEERSQAQNERIAWRRMAESPQFKAWAGMQLQAREDGWGSVEAKVEKAMSREEDFVIDSGSKAVKCVPKESHCDKKS